MSDIRILIVNDHPLMRAALRDAIEGEPDFEIVGEAVNGQQAVELAAKLKPQVVLMDLYMPVMDGIEATRLIMAQNQDVRVLAITSSNEDEKVVAAVRAGAAGYILKDFPRDRILIGLRDVAAGRRFIPPEIGEKLARGLQAEMVEVQPNPITTREHDVLTLVGNGFSNTEIASRLVLSEATVRVHIANIMHKLELHNRIQLAIYAQKNKARP